MKTDYCKQTQESNAEFNARIDAEDKECMAIPCPLETCGADVNEPCCTEAGQPRLRHARRLWLVRRESDMNIRHFPGDLT